MAGETTRKARRHGSSSRGLNGGAPHLAQAGRGRAPVQLGHARRSDVEQPRHFAQRNILQIMEHDHRRLRLRQPGDALRQRAAVLDRAHACIRPRRGGIGQALGERQVLLAVTILRSFRRKRRFAGVGSWLGSRRDRRAPRRALRPARAASAHVRAFRRAWSQPA